MNTEVVNAFYVFYIIGGIMAVGMSLIFFFSKK